MNEISRKANEPSEVNPNTKLVVTYLVVLGLLFGIPITLGLLSRQSNINSIGIRFIAILIYLVLPLLAARGISQYKKWGWISGLIISWLLILRTGFGGLSYLVQVVGNPGGASWSSAIFFTLVLYVGIFVASTLVVRFLSRHKAAFSSNENRSY